MLTGSVLPQLLHPKWDTMLGVKKVVIVKKAKSINSQSAHMSVRFYVWAKDVFGTGILITVAKRLAL